MTKIAVLFGVTERNFDKILPRLRRLVAINPDAAFFPIIGPKQLVHFPMIVDKFMLGSTARLPVIGEISHIINWLASSAPGVYKISKAINKITLTLFKSNQLKYMVSKLNQLGFKNTYVDFTPMPYWNIDHSILSWYNDLGQKFNFDYLIFYEADIFTSKPLDEIYQKNIETSDVSFACLKKVEQNDPYPFPPGSRGAIKRWLRKRKISTKLYRSIFAGALISRKCLERLQSLGLDFSGIPYSNNEVRLPTVLAALGFKCCSLDFPFVRYRPEWSWDEILQNQNSGIFHPIKDLTPIETD